MADPIADSEKESITDLLKGYLFNKELQDIVEILHENRFSPLALQSMPSSEINDLILKYFPEGLPDGAKTGFRMAIQRRKESTHGSSSTLLMETMENLVKAVKENIEKTEKTVKEYTEQMGSVEKMFKRMREEAELDRQSKKSFLVFSHKIFDSSK